MKNRFYLAGEFGNVACGNYKLVIVNNSCIPKKKVDWQVFSESCIRNAKINKKLKEGHTFFS